jgi:hypothetical protein
MTDGSKQHMPGLGDEKIIWLRLVRSLMVGGELAKPGEPIEVDWQYITGQVDSSRAYGRGRKTSGPSEA